VRLAIVLMLAAAAAFAQLPDAPGKELTQKICNNCHGAETFQSRRLDREGWEKVIDEMTGRGAQASDADFDKIVDYLANVFGPNVNINSASAKELITSLGFSQEEADAMVRYREKNGGFKTLDDVRKVPGISASKIDAKKARIVF
jgi:competence protein ComEA